MVDKNVFPELKECPVCEGQLNTIRYGLHADSPRNDEIDAEGGLEDSSPTKACQKCDWTGGEGGRTWRTYWVEVQTEIDIQGNKQEVTREIDLVSMSIADLIEVGETMLLPRYELVFRGYSPESVDEMFEDRQAPAFPLVQKETIFVHYNRKTRFIEQASHFLAHRMNHVFLYLRPGFFEWESAITPTDYQDAVSIFKDSNLEVWELDLSLEYNADGEVGEWQHYGIPELRAMLANEPVEPEMLNSHATKFDRQIPLPVWFEPGLMLRENARIRKNLRS